MTSVILVACLLFLVGFYNIDDTGDTKVEKILEVKRVVIDAGHGGRDGGVASSNGLRESDVVLKISESLRFELETRGLEVAMTRGNEEGLYDKKVSNRKRDDMRKRREIIEMVEPHIVVSIHLNNFIRDESVYGIQCFYHKAGKGDGKQYATKIQDYINKSGLVDRNREAMPADYYILETKFPSVLIECGFLSNAEEERKLASEEYQRELAKTIADAVVSVLN